MESVCPSLWVQCPFFVGITDINEHIEPVFNAVSPSTAIIPSG
ncbi:MAG: hypothetical protein OFPII_20090 [Osedax symbiont Rs1]|nr:MAG: hypothetical protein OFPII_20090 [Osedax symbiont Rs1]